MKLKHLLLYSKNWYKKTNNIWDDLNLVLQLDGYQPSTNNDIYNIIVHNVPTDFKPFTLGRFLDGIRPSNCWKFGYQVKGYYGDDSRSEDYNYERAVISYIVSELAFTEKDIFGELPKPNYSTGLKKPKYFSFKIK